MILWAVIPKTLNPVENVMCLAHLTGKQHSLCMSDFLYGFGEICSLTPDGLDITDCYIVEIQQDNRVADERVIVDCVQVSKSICYRDVVNVMDNIYEVKTHQCSPDIFPTFMVPVRVDKVGRVYTVMSEVAPSWDLLPWIYDCRTLCPTDDMTERDAMLSCNKDDAADIRRKATILGKRWEDYGITTVGEINKEFADLDKYYIYDSTAPMLSPFYKVDFRYNDRESHSVIAAYTYQSFAYKLSYANLSDEEVMEQIQATILPDWYLRRFNVLCGILRSVYIKPEMRKVLRDTKDKYLIYVSENHDNILGQCMCPRCKYEIGQNLLGKALMKVRSELT